MSENKGNKRQLQGIIVSDKMDKTRVVEVEKIKYHPLYKKRYLRSKRYYAHDENNLTKEGQEVTIIESVPRSKMKRWSIISNS